MDLGANLTVCICTRDRPADLALAIASVVNEAPAANVVVSDDGREPAAAVAARFPRCTWVAGPARGLGANRNNAVAEVRTDWVLFLDDDARLGSGFVPAIERRLLELEPAWRGRAIVTGCERNRGVLIESNDVDFLGFQRRPYAAGAPLHTVVINATVWPRALFEVVHFDERLIYGNDEVDLAYSALAADYRIEACLEAINEHLPADSNRGEQGINAHASRLRVTLKRYWRLQGRHGAAAIYAVIGPAHVLFSLLRQQGLRGFGSFLTVMKRWLGP